MQATLNNPKEFTKLVQVIGLFDSSFNVKCTKQGWSIFCLSSSHSEIVTIELPLAYFASYTYTSATEAIRLGLNVNMISSVLKSAQATDQLHVCAKDNSDNLSLVIEGAEQQLTYEIKLIDIQKDELTIPDLDTNIVFSLKSAMLKSFKSNICDYTGESLSFEPTSESLVLKSNSAHGSVTSTICPGDRMSFVSFNDPQPVTLGAKSITIASKIAEIAPNCTIAWTNDTPVKVHTELGGGLGNICMWFAPLIAD